MSDLSETIALVTGGASGIGRAIVERFVTDGARVMIADVDAVAGEALAAALGERCLFQYLDVTRAEDWSAALSTVAQHFGVLSCLVNNAGVSTAGSIATTTETDWARTMAVNATGAFLGCQAAVKILSPNGGTIINISSARGQRPSAGQIAYCASKAAMLTLTQSVALHCGETGLPIRCNAVCPGIIDTPILNETKALLGGGDIAYARLGSMQPIGRLGLPSEVASMVAYLASPEARFVTGATINVDGGFAIRDK
jgi:3alpha(or 20beta)-hydroxysteroid dehydrogenase